MESLFILGDMRCGHCVMEAQDALMANEGVYAVHISLESSLARVAHDENMVSTEELINIIVNAGFTVRRGE